MIYCMYIYIFIFEIQFCNPLPSSSGTRGFTTISLISLSVNNSSYSISKKQRQVEQPKGSTKNSPESLPLNPD